MSKIIISWARARTLATTTIITAAEAATVVVETLRHLAFLIDTEECPHR